METKPPAIDTLKEMNKVIAPMLQVINGELEERNGEFQNGDSDLFRQVVQETSENKLERYKERMQSISSRYRVSV